MPHTTGPVIDSPDDTSWLLLSLEPALLRSGRSEPSWPRKVAGHSSIQTTERYLGFEQEIEIAVNDNLGL
jgi:hypothetical protein